MRRSLLLAILLLGPLAVAAQGQILDQTMVPTGRVRLQAHGIFESWDTRFGRDESGNEGEELLGSDLTSPSALTLFPGVGLMTDAIGQATGTPFDPLLGPTDGYVRQDITRIDFGAAVGITEWLTFGAVLPWMHTRTAMDLTLTTDTVNGNVGVNPSITSASAVGAFLGSTATANAAAAAAADAACAPGPSTACSAAQDLAARAAALDAALTAAYGASVFFPLAGTTAGAALDQTTSALSTDLVAAGLGGLAPVVLPDALVTEADLARLPFLAGSGLETGPIASRRSLWAAGDAELFARIRILDNLTPSGADWTHPGFGYRVTGRLLARIPTGRQPDPDFLLDLGTGDGQLDMEGGVAATFAFGRHLGLSAGAYYGIQGETTLTTRVAPPETVLRPLSSRTEVTWRPGAYMGVAAAPHIHLGSSLALSGEYRFFHKRRDEFELLDPSLPLNRFALAIESGVKAHQVGGGLRYSTLNAWRSGEANLPMELHLRIVSTIAGSGGQTPKSTRVEAGIRLFRRFWGRP